jgi:hypothetical protein
MPVDGQVLEHAGEREATPVKAGAALERKVLVHVVDAREVDDIRAEHEPEAVEQAVAEEIIEVRIDVEDARHYEPSA